MTQASSDSGITSLPHESHHHYHHQLRCWRTANFPNRSRLQLKLNNDSLPTPTISGFISSLHYLIASRVKYRETTHSGRGFPCFSSMKLPSPAAQALGKFLRRRSMSSTSASAFNATTVIWSELRGLQFSGMAKWQKCC